jgi:hypothetical protein
LHAAGVPVFDEKKTATASIYSAAAATATAARMLALFRASDSSFKLAQLLWNGRSCCPESRGPALCLRWLRASDTFSQCFSVAFATRFRAVAFGILAAAAALMLACQSHLAFRWRIWIKRLVASALIAWAVGRCHSSRCTSPLVWSCWSRKAGQQCQQRG